MEKFKVTFYPDNKTVEVEKDKTVLSAAISAGVYINSSCGGDGVCGRCKVILKKGEVFSQSSGRLTQEERKRGIHLACAAQVQSDLEIEIPADSRLSLEGLTQEEVNARMKKDYTEPEEVEPAGKSPSEGEFVFAPLSRKVYLELPAPAADEKLSDLERLERQISLAGNISVRHTCLSNIKSLGELLRSSDWKVTASLGKREDFTEILLIEPGDTSCKNFGVAFDIGTTTVSGQLIDLNTGKALGTKATYNKQAQFGSDVITRIMYAKNEQGLEDLHRAVVADMNQMIIGLAGEHNVDLNDVTYAVCAGNTTMIHLLLRVDPTYIRREPYVPTLNFVPVLRASEVELRISPRGLLYCVPGVASYVGGDVTSGVISSGLYKQEQLCVLIDIGTNGEIVLGNRDFLISCAASAGPAFEGSGVSCGMRSSKGAIQKVKISSGSLELSYSVIGGVKPLGICGSGYIDIIAGMLGAGIVDKDGKIKEAKNKKVRQGAEGREFVIAERKDSANGKDIVITDVDIENLKRAKAAIYSGVSMLARHVGLDLAKAEKFFVAGGFGTYLDMDNAIRIGLLPDLPRDRFVFIGNSSLSGARQMLLSSGAVDTAREIAKKITYLDLSAEPRYMDEYMAALFFPHTDLLRFPSIKH
ncbi:MAG: ASKHA domain-containing protein [Candidatus Omnitrophica bacterium]|nr:ASKHA domain-containing protein [Candidatus Omnitrophota bacterium]MDD5553149.1 ASKHA domain-containing protein [Candidatus Omnitrophota bacterium]